MYQLYCNKYQVRTVSFEADIDAIACTIGDVILVAHDVPKWAKSGRIEKVEGQELLLPVELEDTSGNYRIQYRTVNDNLYTSAVTILGNKDGWCRVEVATPFSETDPPQRHDIFDLAIATVGSKPFVVKSITRAQDFTRRITGIEYNENMYNEDYDIPEIHYSSEDARPKNVTNVSATKYSCLTPEGVTRYKMNISWERASTGKFTVFVSEEGETWDLLVSGLTATEYTADVDAGTGFVKITTTNGAVITSGTIAAITNIDTMMQQLTISGLAATVEMSGSIGTVRAVWDAITASNLKHYKVMFRGSEYNTINPNAEFGGVPEGSYVLSVRAVTNQGAEGTAASVMVEVAEPEPGPGPEPEPEPSA